MKKFLSLVLALVMALSVTVVGFADLANLTCDSCLAKLSDEKAYNAHINGGCLIDFKACQYCTAKVATNDLGAHELECPKGAGKCEYCNEAYDNQADYAAHKAGECKMINTVGSEDTAKIVDKVLDFLADVDWKGLADKVVDAVKGIDIGGLVAKIKPIVEKIVAFVTDAVGEIDIKA